MASTYEVRGRATTWADSLATQTGETVRIGTLHEHFVLIVHHVPGPDDASPTPDIGSFYRYMSPRSERPSSPTSRSRTARPELAAHVMECTRAISRDLGRGI